jgi:hypothetical protein
MCRSAAPDLRSRAPAICIAGPLAARARSEAICPRVATWPAFSQEQPELASAGNALFYQHGVGLAFMATLRADGRPRLHPMCPIISDDGLFAFIIPSPKQADLRRDGVYAMHSFPRPDNEDAFYVTGRARLATSPSIREALAAQFVQERSQFPVAPPSSDDALFEFELDSCLLTRTTGHGDPKPLHTVWREAAPTSST